MNGFNATALAYGVTGTGKTHTMFGDLHINLSLNEKGICIHAADHLFDMIRNETSKNFMVKINYIEIYNEQVIDLLVEKRHESNDHLMIIEDPVKGVLVPEASEYTVTCIEEVMNLIQIGNSRRVMAPTSGNQFSSRSHAILQVIVEQRTNIGGKEEIISSKLLLVDLAGSERGSMEKGIRREEGANINKSLLALGNCINILSDKHKKGSFVPYRDSKLTRLLKDSLGGNISTIMIACISPSLLSQDETINTLKYASRARKIQKKIIRNVKEIDNNSSQYKELIESLKKEIIQLKEVISNQNILLKYKPVDSFFDSRDVNNMNFNFNNRGQLDASYKDNQDINNFYPHNLKSKLLLSNSVQAEIPGNNMNLINNFNFDVYEEFLKKNFNSLSEEELDELSKKMER
jgi:kinesin family protein 18/19